ncbi:MAG: DNA-3-methyladenine glycosylase 2 family protein [Acidobacteria bacterium]|nr:DNA-3-methyladenine glycosylase 2 family protein [Acidobacteriota bacterium]
MKRNEKRAAVLTKASLARGLAQLSAEDKDLARVLERCGEPPLWEREAGFETLVYIMLEQQVSLASAKAVYERLLAQAAPLTPARLLELDDARLKSIGFSRQKIAYTKGLARAIEAGELDLAALELMSDEAARAELIKLKGIGAWTADIYLLRALLRADVWPSGDLALAVAAHEVKRLTARPTHEELNRLAEAWRPWRAVAARVLWQHYLCKPARQA